MSLCLRGVIFRNGEVVRSFANLDPTRSETFRVDLPLEPGDVIYIVDDSLSVAEFDLLSQQTTEGRFTEEEVRTLTPARYEFTVPPVALGPGESLWWTQVGRREWGTIGIRQDDQRGAAGALRDRVQRMKAGA